MTLLEKIKSIYSELSESDFLPITGTIRLEDAGEGAYIAKWEHPTLAQPTQEQLDGISA
jgi:hypothetical protein